MFFLGQKNDEIIVTIATVANTNTKNKNTGVTTVFLDCLSSSCCSAACSAPAVEVLIANKRQQGAATSDSGSAQAAKSAVSRQQAARRRPPSERSKFYAERGWHCRRCIMDIPQERAATVVQYSSSAHGCALLVLV